MRISFTSKGSWSKTESFLTTMQKLKIRDILNKFGAEGVAALAGATPQDTGLAAQSWGYEVSNNAIIWTNSDVEGGFPVAIMLQFGYGTGTGGYVQGYDYINPAIKPVFDRIADEVWRVVTSA